MFVTNETTDLNVLSLIYSVNLERLFTYCFDHYCSISSYIERKCRKRREAGHSKVKK